MKRFIKLFLMYISSIIYRNHKSKILYYHDICRGDSYKSLDSDILMGTSIELFKKHLCVIKSEGYKIVPKISSNEGEVAIFLDDGFRGIWDNRHFFYENNIKPTIFLACDLIGQDGFLTISEIIELQNHGFIFECHSWSHTDLSHYSNDRLKRELFDSKELLSQKLLKDINEICLPLGYYSNNLLKNIKKYNYIEVYSSIPGNFDSKVANYMRRRNCCQFATSFEVKLILCGGNEIIKSRYEKLHNKSINRYA